MWYFFCILRVGALWYNALTMPISTKTIIFYFILALNIFGVFGLFWYQDMQLQQLRTTHASVRRELVSTSRELALTKIELQKNSDTLNQMHVSIDSLNHLLATTQGEKSNLQESVIELQSFLDAMQEQIAGVSGTVGTLEKLSNTDKELLQKYSKVYFLNENFVPRALFGISPEYLVEPDKPKLILGDVFPFLQNMLDDAKVAGVDLRIISAYRSFGEQSALKSTYKVTYGSGSANKFSADQGYSEHQLGTTIDLSSKTLGLKYTLIEKDKAFAWLTENAYKYGFVLSYPKNNKFYIYEPWHWRFVGKTLALRLHSENKYFYDLTQREIDQYLVLIFDR